MKLMAALTGNLDQMLADEVRIAEQAVTHSIREATDGLKTELRNQITGAGLGQRLANTWRGEVYPKGKMSIKAAGLVYSRAPVIVGAHDQGATIRSKDGFWLAIPLPAAGKGPRGKRMTPGLWERLRGQRLRFIYRRGKPSLLVAENQRARQGQRGGFSVASKKAQATGGHAHDVLEAARGKDFVILRDVYRGRADPNAMQSSIMHWERDMFWLYDAFRERPVFDLPHGDQANSSNI